MHAGSFFIHLPDYLFKAWLRVLSALVNNDGLLCFTVRSDWTNVGRRRWGDLDSSGILFLRKSESDVLPYEVYGLTMVTDAHVAQAIRESIGEARVFCFRKAFYENQDLYVVSRAPRSTFGAIRPRIALLCGVSSIRHREHITGWGLDLADGGSITMASLSVDGRLLQTIAPSDATPDIIEPFPGTPLSAAAKLMFHVPAMQVHSESLVAIDVETNNGETNRCYVSPSKLAVLLQ